MSCSCGNDGICTSEHKCLMCQIKEVRERIDELLAHMGNYCGERAKYDVLKEELDVQLDIYEELIEQLG